MDEIKAIPEIRVHVTRFIYFLLFFELFYLGLMAILHYSLGLPFVKVCEQNASQMGAKPEQNATDSRFCPTHSVICKHFLAFGLRFGFFLHFHSCFGYQHVGIITARITARKTREKSKTQVNQHIM